MIDLTQDMTLEQAVRYAITTEYDAVNIYETVASMSDDKKIKELMLDIATEEKVHIGELETLLSSLDEEVDETAEKGSDEAREILTVNITNQKEKFIMNNKLVRQLRKMAREIKADSFLDVLEGVVKQASSFMNVGQQLKNNRIKYDFSTNMMPMYIINKAGKKYAILNKKYVDDADVYIGDIAIGIM